MWSGCGRAAETDSEGFPMPQMQPRLVGLATAVPENAVAQTEILSAAGRAFAGRVDGFRALSQVFSSAGIDRRHLARPIEWYMQPHGWEDRNAAYLDTAPALFLAAARRALGDAGKTAREVDFILTVSSTGIATPGLEAMVADRIGFRADAVRIPVFGWGCAGGAAGLALAAQLAALQPGTTVLVVALELCSLSFRLDVLSKENIVATALFGDGAAAAVVASSGDGPVLHAPRQHRWPDTLGIMGWRVQDRGLGVIFDRAIPPFAEAHLADALHELWPELDGRSVGHICHPGGAKVITALEAALRLPAGTLRHERAVLADFGNMSAPTVLFVLDAALREGELDDSLLLALGPGFSLAGLRVGDGLRDAG